MFLDTMKGPILHTFLAAGILAFNVPASASDEPSLAEHAQTLAALASGMENAFCEDLQLMRKHRSPSRDELLFRESLCQLAGIANQFRRAVELNAPACDMERGFAAVVEATECVEGCARGVNVCAEICGMMREFGQGMVCVTEVGFEAVPRRGAGHAHHHHEHGPTTAPQGGNGWFRVPLPQRLPFVFRQPMR